MKWVIELTSSINRSVQNTANSFGKPSLYNQNKIKNEK